MITNRLISLTLAWSAALTITGCYANTGSTAFPASSAQTQQPSAPRQTAGSTPAVPSGSPSQAFPSPSPSTGGNAQLIDSYQSGTDGWFIYSENNRSELNVYTTRDGGRSYTKASLPIRTDWEKEAQRDNIFASFHPSREKLPDAILITSGPGLGLMEKTLYRSTGDGKWEFTGNLTRQVDGYVTGMIFPAQDMGFISATYHGNTPLPFYRTADGGKTWKAVPIPIPEGYKYANVSAPVFATGQNGSVPIQFVGDSGQTTILYTTTDGGNTWKAS